MKSHDKIIIYLNKWRFLDVFLDGKNAQIIKSYVEEEKEKEEAKKEGSEESKKKDKETNLPFSSSLSSHLPPSLLNTTPPPPPTTTMERIQETSTWEQLKPCNRFYRRLELYDMEWGVDLKECLVVLAPFGGPIAVRGNPKMASYRGEKNPYIDIYTSSGESLVFSWTKGNIVGWGWSNREQLIIVTEEGLVTTLPLTARSEEEIISQYDISEDIDEPIIDSYVWGTGCVMMTKSFQFWTLGLERRRKKASPIPFAASGLIEPPTAWTVLEPEYTISHDVEVLIASSSTIFVLDFDECQDQYLTETFTSLSVACGGQLIACYTEKGVLMVLSSDFHDNKLVFSTGCTVPPQQFVWCGYDTVLMSWENVLLMVGPKKDDRPGWLKLDYDEPICIVTEMDGARIISNSDCKFLQKVPDVTEEIFKGIDSMTPSALLFEASIHFEQKSEKAYENIREIKKGAGASQALASAVAACTEAAGYEFSEQKQRRLLKAASFGKCFLDMYSPDDFVSMCKQLRVLNGVFSERIGIPITNTQLQKVTLKGLIERLIQRNEHLLALRICEYMNLDKHKVLVQWACAKVIAAKNTSDPQSLGRLIYEKLSKTPGIPYATIAATAYQHGHRELALLLLEDELRPSAQVPLLMKMQQDDQALVKAIQSGDTNLVYLAILQIKRLRSGEDFLRIIQNKHVALSLVIKYCKQQEVDLLKNIYYQQNNMEELGNLNMLEAYQSSSLEDGVKKIGTAVQVYASGGRETAAQCRYAEEEKKLLMMQHKLEKQLQTKFLGLSVTETTYRMLVLGNIKGAEKIKNDFKISEKRYWWLRLRAIAESEDWKSLHELARERKTPPIGWEPFAEVCIKHKQTQEAMRYIQKVPNLEARMKLWMTLGYWRDAADIAKELKDVKTLVMIRGKCTDNETNKYLDKMLHDLGVQIKR